MKNLSTRITAIIGGILVLITASAFIGYYPGGSPGGYSGSPLDGKNCTYCHSGTAATLPGIITSDIDTNGYIPGTKYNITVSVPGTGLKGFEVSPLNSAHEKAGTLAAGFENRLVNSGKSVTHSVTSGSNPAVWSFNWTAPVSGSGSVIFYGAFTAGKSHTLLSTLIVKEKKAASIVKSETNRVRIIYQPELVKLIFESNFTLQELCSAQIYTVNGTKVLEIPSKNISAGKNRWEIDISSIKKPGIYVVTYSFGEINLSEKVFIF